ncbi:MAG: hypothetical protein QOC78_1373 [Solirubrobacteraceae bacterium]|nr:hypothetical protein [Solirubrobacteraceae bacterium]
MAWWPTRSDRLDFRATHMRQSQRAAESAAENGMTWNDLANIDRLETLSNADRDVVEEVREVLARHGALGRFGLTLLHSHFELAPHEVLVETVDPDGRRLVTEARSVSDLPAGTLVPTSWRLDGTEPVPIIHCWRYPSGMHAQ